MLWIEMSRDASRPTESPWGLGNSLWSPSRNENGNRWGFWETLLRVEEGDPVLHLVGSEDPVFAGISVADSSGYETDANPDYGTEYYNGSRSLYRVHLRDFTRFETPYPLDRLFEQYREEIIEYYERNRDRPSAEKRKILPVVTGGRLQCLMGAYLSEVTGEWREILMDYMDSPPPARGTSRQSENLRSSSNGRQSTVSTGSQKAEVERRTGQKEFSDEVKSNYGQRCCFPECDVEAHSFLVGSHIARWADVPELRGEISNGLCLCLMHDKAFEDGLFTLNSSKRVWANSEQIDHNSWSAENIRPYHGERIDQAPVEPSTEALQYHWDRVNLDPQ